MLIEPDQAVQFLEKYKAIMRYLNKGDEPSSHNHYTELRTELYQRLDDIENDCADEVGHEFIESLRSAIVGRFVYLKKYQKGYVFQSVESSKYYQAKALTTPLDDLMDDFWVIETALISFDQQLICDGLFLSPNISIGKNMMKDIRDGYWEAKRAGELVTS